MSFHSTVLYNWVFTLDDQQGNNRHIPFNPFDASENEAGCANINFTDGG